jgi:hypothetical protein
MLCLTGSKEIGMSEIVVPDLGTNVDRQTGRAFALPELITPQIDHFEESRFWGDLIPQFLMVEGVGSCTSTELTKDSARRESNCSQSITRRHRAHSQAGRTLCTGTQTHGVILRCTRDLRSATRQTCMGPSRECQ